MKEFKHERVQINDVGESIKLEGWRWFCFWQRWWFCFLFPATMVVVLFSVSGDGGGGSIPLRLDESYKGGTW
ncbi:hypothetical protein P8452_47297 [Trifolium repens]|nr:hypothetical protein P8452_47297 [Trifolium repens]